MNPKFLYLLAILLGISILSTSTGCDAMYQNTKKNSPETVVEFEQGNTKLSVFYNRPYKKDRVIFGELVPYGEVWRTGANEPSTFTTNTDIMVGGEPLKAGTYSIWTIPGEKEWELMLNTEIPSWGIGLGGKAKRNPDTDAVRFRLKVKSMPEVMEQFTISFEESNGLYMSLAWDQTKVSLPISIP